MSRTAIFFLTLVFHCSWLQVEGLSYEEHPMTLSAAKADYKDKMIVLDGDVNVEHELGKMSAKHAEMHFASGPKKAQIELITLQEKVSVLLQDGGQLSCASADFFCLQLQGVFRGDVIYTEMCKSKLPEAVPLIVKGAVMTLEIARLDTVKNSLPKNFVKQITIDRDVYVNYNHDFIVRADKGIYRKDNQDADENQLTGTITLQRSSQSEQCKVVNRNGDFINAARIDIDVFSKEIVFTDPSGIISGVNHEKAKGQQVEFSADILMWSHVKDLLVLQKNVVVQQAGFGRLTSNGQVRLFQQVIEGKKQLKRLEAEGDTIIAFHDPEKSLNHTLISHGQVSVDHQNLLTSLESPKNDRGIVKNEHQISFQDSQGEIFADKAYLYYVNNDGKIVLSSVKLEGNVRLKDKQTNGDGVLHYIVADYVDFVPEAKELTFTAKPKRRVLFYDKINNVQVSAPALKIKRDEATKKESVKGVGDVRFSFIEKEYAELRKRFKLDLTENSLL